MTPQFKSRDAMVAYVWKQVGRRAKTQRPILQTSRQSMRTLRKEQEAKDVKNELAAL